MENSEIILNYIDNHNSTAYQIAKSTGISESTISKWRKSPTSKIDVSVVQKIAMFYGVTISELLDENQANLISVSNHEQQLLKYYNELDEISKASVLGKAEGLAEAARRQKALAPAPTKKAKPKSIKPPEPEPTDEPEDETEYVYMPFFDLPVSAGTGVYLDSEDAKKIRVPANEDTRKSDYALRVSGDSMEPRYYDGDIVLVRQQQYVEEGEVGIFLYNDDGYIKIFGGDRLISLNKKYKDMMLSENDQFICLGKVMGILSIQYKFK